MTSHSQEFLRLLCNQFMMYGDFLLAVPFGSGHVNDTYQVTYDQGGVRLHYTLQRINGHVFPEPEKVMENIDRVTAHILSKIRYRHQETRRRTLRLLRTREGVPFVRDEFGDIWRAYVFIENARAYETLETPEQAFCLARAVGEFQRDLTDLPGGRLHETIRDFHHTPKRIEALERAIKNDICGRVKEVSREIDFVMKRKEEAGTLLRLVKSGAIPERITHNDTKSANVLIDDLTGEGCCMLDLDTVMPGISLYDFGDMIRAGTNTAAEDETNIDKVGLRFELYEAITKGFLSAAGTFLTEAEREYLPFAGKLITLETGVRFLTDYLEGDHYFKTARMRHNLDRCRTQFQMVNSIEKQFDAMRRVTGAL